MINFRWPDYKIKGGVRLDSAFYIDVDYSFITLDN